MPDQRWSSWKPRWEAVMTACRERGGEAQPLKLAPPASPELVGALEDRLGKPLPVALSDVLTGFSGSVEVTWTLPDDAEPDGANESTWGECAWSLDGIARAEASRQAWVAECFPNRDEPYDLVWHDKLGIIEVRNGDVVAIDVSRTPAPVVYLSHDDGEGHGLVLGTDFSDFIDRWTGIGCVGPEDWTWLPFCGDSEPALDPDSAAAATWRRWMGLPV